MSNKKLLQYIKTQAAIASASGKILYAAGGNDDEACRQAAVEEGKYLALIELRSWLLRNENANSQPKKEMGDE